MLQEIEAFFIKLNSYFYKKSKMTNLKILITALLILFFNIAKAQNNESKKEKTPFIEVTGVAEKEIIPDEIFISITLSEKLKNKSKISIEEQEENLKKSIKTLGIELSNLYLSNTKANYEKYFFRQNVLTKKEYTLKVSNANTVGKVFLEFDKIDIDDAIVSKVSHSKIDSFRKEVKIMAIKAAKDKADYLLSAIGEKLGKALQINEIEIKPSSNNNQESNILANMSGGVYKRKDALYWLNPMDYNEKNELEFQKIKIKSAIYLKYSIK